MLEASPPGRESARGSVIYFRTADIVTLYHKLQAKGVSFVDDPHLIAKMPGHELWMAFFHDPSGNLLALMAELPLKA